jgi:hypothetical protein
MGWLIRFIHNRDLAAENIVTAYMRQRFVLAAPAEALDSLQRKLDKAGMVLPVRSLLNNATRVVQQRGSLAGAYEVDVPRNERKESTVDLTGSFYSAHLASSARATASTYNLGRPNLTKVIALQNTIRINSRPYKFGDYVEFALHVGRSMSARSDSPENRGVGIIKAFYLVPCGRGHGVTSRVFVAMNRVPAEIRSTGFHLLSLDDPSSQDAEYVRPRMIHVDSITYKLHRVPQPSIPGTEEDDHRFCFLRIWESR